MELTELLRNVVKAIDDAGVPEDLRLAAFERGFDVLARQAGVADPAHDDRGSGTGSGDSGSGDGGARQHHQEGGGGSPAPTERLAKVAKSLDIPADRIGDFFGEYEESLQLHVDPGDLGDRTSEQTRKVGLLLAAGRQLGGYDSERTPLESVRDECKRLRCYDADNFSTYVGDLTKYFSINGSGKSRTLLLKPGGNKAAKELVKELLGK